MEKEIINFNGNVFAYIYNDDNYIFHFKSAIKFFDEIVTNNNTKKIIIDYKLFSKDFFILQNNLLEKVLKELRSNSIQLVILIEFELFKSDIYLDFFYKYNKEKNIFFLETLEEGLFALK